MQKTGSASQVRQLLMKPDFIIIGTMKSGTTSLHSILSRHLEIFMTKEEVSILLLGVCRTIEVRCLLDLCEMCIK